MGIVQVNSSMSLDGFIAGPHHEMDWVFDNGFLPDEPVDAVEEVIRTTGAILSGRGSYDVGRAATRRETTEAFGGRWTGPQFVLTHRPPDETNDEVIFLSGAVGPAVTTAVAAAQGKNLLVLGANVVQQCLKEDLVDEILVMVLPIVLGGGISLFGRLDRQVLFETVGVAQVGQTAILRFRRSR